jgi:hypothetical protein
MSDRFEHAQREEAARRLHRAKDPDTSREAARVIAGRLTQIQQEVLAYALKRADRGFTDAELTAAFYCGGGSTYRTRRAELSAQGLIVDTGRRRSNGPGRKHTIWIHANFAA